MQNQEFLSAQSQQAEAIQANVEVFTKSQKLAIEGANCMSCVVKIENALKQVDGVTSASMNFPQRNVTISGDVASEILIGVIDKAGYKARVSDHFPELVTEEK